MISRTVFLVQVSRSGAAAVKEWSVCCLFFRSSSPLPSCRQLIPPLNTQGHCASPLGAPEILSASHPQVMNVNEEGGKSRKEPSDKYSATSGAHWHGGEKNEMKKRKSFVCFTSFIWSSKTWKQTEVVSFMTPQSRCAAFHMKLDILTLTQSQLFQRSVCLSGGLTNPTPGTSCALTYPVRSPPGSCHLNFIKLLEIFRSIFQETELIQCVELKDFTESTGAATNNYSEHWTIYCLSIRF